MQEAKADEAAAARVRERWLRHQAGEQTRFALVLADAAGRGITVRVRAEGSAHAGRIAAVGHDFVSIVTTRGGRVLVALDAVAAVEAAATTALGGGRDPDDDTVDPERAWLAERLADAVADHPRVEVRMRGGDRVVGELRGSGVDVVVVRTDGAPPQDCYVPLSSLSALTFLGSG